jgi:hypothetical protein
VLTAAGRAPARRIAPSVTLTATIAAAADQVRLTASAPRSRSGEYSIVTTVFGDGTPTIL